MWATDSCRATPSWSCVTRKPDLYRSAALILPQISWIIHATIYARSKREEAYRYIRRDNQRESAHGAIKLAFRAVRRSSGYGVGFTIKKSGSGGGNGRSWGKSPAKTSCNQKNGWPGRIWLTVTSLEVREVLGNLRMKIKRSKPAIHFVSQTHSYDNCHNSADCYAQVICSTTEEQLQIQECNVY